MQRRQFSIGVLLVTSVVLFLYAWGALPQTFFQQDEWFGFSKALYSTQYGLLSVLKPTGFHFFPFTTVFFISFFKVFGFHSEIYGYVSLSLHILNAFLVYRIVKMLGGVVAGIISFSMFLVFFLSHQAFSWYAASLSLLPGATCGLLSIHFYLRYVEKNNLRYYYFSLILWCISILFKEDFFVLYGMFITINIVFQIKHTLRNALGLHGCLVLLLSFRFMYMSEQALPVIANPEEITWMGLLEIIGNREMKMIRNLIFPTSGFGQIQMIFTSVFMVKSLFSSEDILLFIRWVLGGYIIAMCVYAFLIFPRITRKYVTVFFVVLLTSVMPYILLPGQESRHYYLAGILFVSIIAVVLSTLFKKGVFFWKASCAVFLFIFFYTNVSAARNILPPTVRISEYRKAFINQFLNTYTEIPKKVVFIGTGDRPFFQSGLGHMMMVLLMQSGRRNYADFFPYFLWNISENGYKEIGQTGFGYYYTWEAFHADANVTNNVPDMLYVYEWNDKNQVLIDKTKNFLVQKSKSD